MPAARYDREDEADDLDESEDPDPDDQDSDDFTDAVDCPHCGGAVYEHADVCPHCRSFISLNDTPSKRRPWFRVGVVLAILAMLVWIFLTAV